VKGSQNSNKAMPRNPQLIPGVERYSRSAAFKRRRDWKKKKITEWKPVAKKVVKKEAKVKKFGNSTRTIQKKAPKFYSEEDVRHKLPSRKHKHRPTRLRRSITPGTVLILVSGRFRGHRVVFLRQLKSGLLLVTGPFKVNGVPLRRVNQAYVIATSARVDMSGVKIDDKFNDAYFRPKKEKKLPKSKKDADQPKTEEKPKQTGKKSKSKLPSSRLDDQKAIDGLLLPIIKKTPLMRQYLKDVFTLRKNQYPHLMKF